MCVCVCARACVRVCVCVCAHLIHCNLCMKNAMYSVDLINEYSVECLMNDFACFDVNVLSYLL